MIVSFGDKETEKVWHVKYSRKLPCNIQQFARRKLRMINNSQDVNDLKLPPGNRLEALKADWTGYYSIRINIQWRIIFRWEKGHASDVQVVDYH